MSRQFSNQRERRKECRKKSQRLRGRAKDQGLARSWIECYDVLRRVVATKTMRLVTVIVRSVRLRAVTNRVVPTLSLQPSRRFRPSLPSAAPSAPCNETLVRSRATFYPRYKLRERCSPFSNWCPRKQCCAPKCCEFMIYIRSISHMRDLCRK